MEGIIALLHKIKDARIMELHLKCDLCLVS
jgi:hypothetical protein